jgi:hypothetical protein
MDINWSVFVRRFNSFDNIGMGDIGFWGLFIVLTISLFCSLFIAFLYAKFYKNRMAGTQIYRSFPLLGVSITAIFITIQFSLPLSLGLLGALSIVRFRTPIKDPEEIGFIMLVVATSICCATFNLVFLGITLIIAVLALLALNFGRNLYKRHLNDGTAIITMLTKEYQEKSSRVFALLEKNIPKSRLDSITENYEESVISYSFGRVTQDILPKLLEELKQISGTAKLSIFFNRSLEA